MNVTRVLRGVLLAGSVAVVCGGFLPAARGGDQPTGTGRVSGSEDIQAREISKEIADGQLTVERDAQAGELGKETERPMMAPEFGFSSSDRDLLEQSRIQDERAALSF